MNNRASEQIVQFIKWEQKGIELLIRITSFCNLACKYCFVQRDIGMPQKGLVLRAISNVVNESGYKKGIDKIYLNITGGEPLVRKDLFELFEALNDIFGNFEANIQTNSTLVGRKEAERLYNYNVKSAFVGMPALNMRDYQFLTGSKDGLKKALDGINHLLNAGIDVCLNFVLTRVTMDDFIRIPEFIKREFGNRVAVNLSSLSPGTPVDFFSQYGVSYCEAAEIFQRIFNKLVKYGIPYGGFGGDCSPPLCAFTNKKIIRMYDFGSINLEIRYLDKFTDCKEGIRYKHLMCRKCKYDERCPGVSHLYANKYRELNFRPVKVTL